MDLSVWNCNNHKQISIAAWLFVVFGVVFLCPRMVAGADTEKKTLDSVAASHQDAVLSHKYFEFDSVIRDTSGGIEVMKASGTVNIEGWSHYMAEARRPGTPGTVVLMEYYTKDEFCFRDVKIQGGGFTPVNDTFEGWDNVDSDVFHGEVPLNSLYYFVKFLDDDTAIQPAGKTEAGGCVRYEGTRSDEGGKAAFSMCIDEKSGLVADFKAVTSGDGKTASTGGFEIGVATRTLDAAPVIQPPEKVLRLYDMALIKKEKENKKKR